MLMCDCAGLTRSRRVHVHVVVDQRGGQRHAGRIGSKFESWRESLSLSVSLFLVLWKHGSRAAHCAVGAFQAGTWTGRGNWKQRSVDLLLPSGLAVNWPHGFGERG